MRLPPSSPSETSVSSHSAPLAAGAARGRAALAQQGPVRTEPAVSLRGGVAAATFGEFGGHIWAERRVPTVPGVGSPWAHLRVEPKVGGPEGPGFQPDPTPSSLAMRPWPGSLVSTRHMRVNTTRLSGSLRGHTDGTSEGCSARCPPLCEYR